MTHRYQSRFSYRPLGEYTFGEYLRPTGFGSYTLGSLSNRPGKDWATPRYVRDEPDRFMSGYGEGEEEEPDRDTATITPGGQIVEPGQTVDVDAEMAAHRDIMDTPKTTTAEDIQYYLDEAAKYGKTALTIGGKVYSTYQTAKQIYDQVTGSQQLVQPTSNLPPPTPLAPVPVDPTLYKSARKASNDQTMATLYNRGLVKASELSANARRMVGLPPLTSANNQTMFLVAGAAVVAFLLLGKK